MCGRALICSDPLGKFMSKVLPQGHFKVFGYSMSLNPGPFNRKEHMLITLMCNVSMTSPYTVDIVPVQYLPQFFNQRWVCGRVVVGPHSLRQMQFRLQAGLPVPQHTRNKLCRVRNGR